MKKIVFVFAFFYVFTAFSQVEIVNKPVKQRIRVAENAIMLNLGYNFPILLNKTFQTEDLWKKNAKIGFGIGVNVEYRRQIMKEVIEDNAVLKKPTWFAFGAGLGVSHWSKSFEFDHANDSFDFKDKDGDHCIVYLDYKNVKEKIRLTYLDIPVFAEFGKLNRVAISGFFRLGLKASVLVSKKLNYEGSYTAIGQYNQWGVPLSNVDVLGYLNNANCYSNPDQKLSPFVLWGSLSGGVNFPFVSTKKNLIAKWILRINANIDYSLTSISKAGEDPYFVQARLRINQSNMLGGNGSRIFSAGFSVSLIYCL